MIDGKKAGKLVGGRTLRKVNPDDEHIELYEQMNESRRLADLDRAWAAGFFDSRGIVNEVKHGKYRSTLQLAISRSGDKDALQRFSMIVIYGSIYEYEPKTPNHQKQWAWRANGEDARYAYLIIEPFLTNSTKQRYAAIEPSCA